IGLAKCVQILKCNRAHVTDPDIPLRELEPLRQQARFAPVQVFNLSSENRGAIVPRAARRYRN
ncbi:hypothetical protein, partial [Aeromonas sobria]|uniref:hypothetical protein n=1 Tax=Aeromonas sobria TaxID=646 RepID=UPI003F402EEF